MDRHKLTGALLVGACAATLARPAGAAVDVDNVVKGEVQAARGVQIYDYGAATDIEVDDPIGWGAGAMVDTVATPFGTLVLEQYGTAGPDPAEPWWDGDWRQRRCYDVANSGTQTLTEYQVRLELDTAALITAGELDADASDLRAVRWDTGTSAFVPLDLWVESWAIGSSRTPVWVQIDTLPAGGSTDFCLYHNTAAPVPSASNRAATFTYSTPKPLYYAVSASFTGSGAGGQVDVTAYADATQIVRDNTPAASLGAGQRTSINLVRADTVVSATGPLNPVGTGRAQDILVPAAFAGTEFVLPTERNTQTWSLRSPWGTTTVQVFAGTTPLDAPVTVAPGSGSVTVTRDVTGAAVARIVSTNGVPFLLTHQTGNGQDSVVAYPQTTEDTFGIFSTQQLVGVSTPGTVAISRSDNTATGAIATDPDNRLVLGGGGGQGTGPAVRTSYGAPGGSVQQADGTGAETTMHWPRRELGDEYWLPSNTRYVAVACPIAGTQVTFGDNAPVDCTGAAPAGSFVGHALDATNLTAGSSGIPVRSVGGQPLYVMWERRSGLVSDEEANAAGWLQGRQYVWPPPTVAARPDEGRYAGVGTWESPAYDTGTDGVFGLADWIANVTLDTGASFQVATAGSASGPWTWRGPLGDPGGTYDPGDTPTPVDHRHDGDRFLKVRITLGSLSGANTPVVETVRIGTRLGELAPGLGERAEIRRTLPTGSRTGVWLARVRTDDPAYDGGAANLTHEAPAVLPGYDALIGFHDGTTEVSVVGGTPDTSPGPLRPFDRTNTLSIKADVVVPTGTTTQDLQLGVRPGGLTSPLVETDLRFTFTGAP